VGGGGSEVARPEGGVVTKDREAWIEGLQAHKETALKISRRKAGRK